ncbi:MAG: TIM-barrel domain-containing protein, partial [Solirubrobacteraceae bacterium]
GWLTISTTQATLRYKLGSGPFGPSNLSVRVKQLGTAAAPQWENECPFGQVCDAGAAALSNGANIQTDHAGYHSIAGFIGGLGQANNAAADWTVLGAPAGQATVQLRYSNYIGALGGPAPRTIDLTVNGSDVKTLTLPATSSWDDWSTVTADVPLKAGTNTVGVACAASDSCTVNVDTLSVAPVGASAPSEPGIDYLGGYTRGFDTATYSNPGYNCPAGTPTAAQCSAMLPEIHPGILDRQGYRLLDDSQSAVWTSNGWVAPRSGNGDVQDGYLFVYGHRYKRATSDLQRLTGASPLLPESTFGVWYSDYKPYTTSDYENTLIPAFRANGVPLDTLSVDTDWKSPNQWDGWEWNPALFPDPQAFLNWAKAQGIHVTLNIHASIADNDPQLAATQALAGTSLADSTCYSTPSACKVWDWSSIPQAQSYFALHQPYENEGVSFWWLDWCCDASTASMAGVTPDNWINHLYAQELANKGERGFVLSRIGSSYQNPDEVYPAGPWSGHTSTLAFTGDTWGTWNTLNLQAQLAADEASIDEPYVSDDIGSFLGPPPGTPSDDPDLYTRWVQLGTFQPILRLHSSNGNRLPWQYPQPADSIAADFLRLREALVPYTYTLAANSVSTGDPITRPLYFDYPGAAAAYSNPSEYLFGPKVLVAPVTTPGTTSKVSMWFPPGRWTDWFTGATFTGPSQQTVNVPLDRMPVFVRAGGIVPEQAAMSHVGADPSAPTTLRVYPGAAGHFSLYQDAGTGNGYEHGQDSRTSITTWTGMAFSHRHGHGASTSVHIGPSRGRYPGQASSRSFSVQIERVSKPDAVLVNGRRLPKASWSYDPDTLTLTVPVEHLGLSQSAVVTELGGAPVTVGEPAALDLSIDPSAPLSLNPGASATVKTTEHDNGPGAATGISVNLTGPVGWTIKPASPVPGGNLSQGGSATQSWTVTAPSGSTPQTATLQAQANYTSAGRPQQVTASQGPGPAPAPLPPPVIDSSAPPTPAPGDSVTLTGQNFGTTQGSSYLTLAQGGTSWGAPYDGAKVTITNWSDNSITFELPPNSGPYPLQPGSASVTVTVAGQTSPAQALTIAGAVAPTPAITSVQPSSTTAGSAVTLTGTNFGAGPGSNS